MVIHLVIVFRSGSYASIYHDVCKLALARWFAFTYFFMEIHVRWILSLLCQLNLLH